MNKAFFGLPIDFNGLLKIYPPLVKDVACNEDYPKYLSLFTMSQEEIEDAFVAKPGDSPNQPIPTPLEYLLGNCMASEAFKKIAEEAFMFFCHEKVTFHPKVKAIIVGDLEEEIKKIKNVNELRIIKEDEYFEFQNLIREVIGLEKVEKPDPTEDPRIKRMKAKIRYRDKIKAKHSGGGLGLEETITSICCMGMGLNPLNIGEMSYAAIKPLMERYQYKERYSIDIRSLLAGASAKKVKPKYWMNKIEDK